VSEWFENWFTKAKEHFDSAVLLKRSGKLRDVLSRLYYAAFSLMVAVCGEPPSGRWKHKGVLKPFFNWLFKEGFSLSEEEQELLKEFYDRRRLADYSTEVILSKEVEIFEELVNKLFEVVDDWRKNNS
jgi:uncharacterized protein (UPF0332 family)